MADFTSFPLLLSSFSRLDAPASHGDGGESAAAPGDLQAGPELPRERRHGALQARQHGREPEVRRQGLHAQAGERGDLEAGG